MIRRPPRTTLNTHAFPTRRSSDLRPGAGTGRGMARAGRPGEDAGGGRSEEHTSQLQSLMRISYAVFCLKKKNVSHTTSVSHKRPSHITKTTHTHIHNTKTVRRQPTTYKRRTNTQTTQHICY